MLRIGLVCLALVAVIASLVEAKTQLIDQDGADVESIAQVVCDVKKGTSKQIGRGSTIAKLASFFGGLPSDHKLAACGAKHAKSIERLAQILATNNDNVCDEPKLIDIEEFHRDYVSRLPKHAESRKKHKLAIPKIIKLFFLHYATEVSSICARDALKQMETFKFNSGDDQKDVPKIDAHLKRFQEYMGTSNLNNDGYNEIFLPWLLVDGLPLEKYTKAASYLAQGDKKLSIKIKGAEKLMKVQTMCSHLLKPIYSRVLLPIIRLISLGYYPSSQEMAQQLAQESPLKRLYLGTQLCETILPIQVFADASMAEDQVTLISPEEAASLTPTSQPAGEPLDGTQFGLTPAENSMSSEFIIEKEKAFASIDEIKANVVSRSKAVGKILRIIARLVTGQMKSKVKKILLKRGDKQEELEPTFDEAKADETSGRLIREYQSEDDEDDGEVSRRKRNALVDVAKFIWETIKFCGTVVYFFILVVFNMVRFFVVGALIVIYTLLRYVTGYAVGDMETALEYMWEVGSYRDPKDMENALDLTWNAFESKRKVKYIGPHKRRIYDI